MLEPPSLLWSVFWSLVWGHLPKVSQHSFPNKIDLSSSIDAPRDQKNTDCLPPKGLEGHLCPGINILGNIYNIDTQ